MLLKKGDILIREGEKSNQLYWLLQGELVVVKMLQEREVVLTQIKEGGLVGELSFLDQKPRSATVKAVTDCQLHVLEYKDYQKMLAAQPRWMKKILISLVNKVRSLSQI
jgi:CRP-like cAMP-binding protein